MRSGPEKGTSMTAILYIFVYATLLVFITLCVVRAYRYATTPVHLRWELYPVPHEEAHRVAHGGSYFESTDWWTKPAHFNLWGELKFMIPEMLFLKGLWEFNRKMWFRSFPFHFGLYVLVGTGALVLVNVVSELLAPGASATVFGAFLHSAYTITGIIGGGLCILGALALLLRRLTDETLKTSTTSGDLFNLAFFIAALVFLFLGLAFREPGAPTVAEIARGLVGFDTSLKIPGLLSVGLILSGLLAAYIPATHMSHFIAKWFTYHSVRWDDRPVYRHRQLARRIAEHLTYRPTWAAAHMGADGSRTWVDIAMTNPAQGVKK
jgi:nitrate reductase gamma subunit